MPLSSLAEELVMSKRMGRRTPVLVTPTYLSLRGGFFACLATEVFERDPGVGKIRVDWMCRTGWLRHRITKRWANQIERVCQSDPFLRNRINVVMAGSIGRAKLESDTLILGICDETQGLPAWAQKIQLFGFEQRHALQVT